MTNTTWQEISQDQAHENTAVEGFVQNGNNYVDLLRNALPSNFSTDNLRASLPSLSVLGAESGRWASNTDLGARIRDLLTGPSAPGSENPQLTNRRDLSNVDTAVLKNSAIAARDRVDQTVQGLGAPERAKWDQLRPNADGSYSPEQLEFLRRKTDLATSLEGLGERERARNIFATTA